MTTRKVDWLSGWCEAVDRRRDDPEGRTRWTMGRWMVDDAADRQPRNQKPPLPQLPHRAVAPKRSVRVYVVSMNKRNRFLRCLSTSDTVSLSLDHECTASATFNSRSIQAGSMTLSITTQYLLSWTLLRNDSARRPSMASPASCSLARRSGTRPPHCSTQSTCQRART